MTPIKMLLEQAKASDPFDMPASKVEWLCKQLLEAEKEMIIAAYFAGYREGSHTDNIDIEGRLSPQDTNAEEFYLTLSQPT
jgi:hypothetical protein